MLGGWAAQVGPMRMGLGLVFKRTVGCEEAGAGVWKDSSFVAGTFCLGLFGFEA